MFHRPFLLHIDQTPHGPDTLSPTLGAEKSPGYGHLAKAVWSPFESHSTRLIELKSGA